MEVYRRFSDFLGLHEKLVVKHLHQGRIIPPAPEKSVIGGILYVMILFCVFHISSAYLATQYAGLTVIEVYVCLSVCLSRAGILS